MTTEKKIEFSHEGSTYRILDTRKGQLGLYTAADDYQNAMLNADTYEALCEEIHATFGSAVTDNLPETW